MTRRLLIVFGIAAPLAFCQPVVRGSIDYKTQIRNKPITSGSVAPSSASCDEAGEVNTYYLQTGNPASINTQMWVCAQSGAATYAWQRISHKTQTTSPAVCAVGDVWFDSDATAGQNVYGCTSANTWTLQGGVTPITEAEMSLTPGSTLRNRSLTTHGFGSILPGDPTKFENGLGDWITPPGAGDLVGPAASVDGEMPLFSGITGKLMKRSTLTGVLGSASGVPYTVTGAPTNYVRVDGTSDAGGAGAVTVGGLNDFKLSRTSGTNLYVRGGTANQGIKQFTIADQTACTVVAAGADTARFYLLNGTHVIGTNTATVTCTGWTMQTGITAFPAGSRPLWEWPVGSTANEWNSTGAADWRSIVSGESYTASTGMAFTPNGSTGRTAVAVDVATTPQFTSGTADASGNCTVGQLYHRTDTGTTWQCPTTNTWVKQARTVFTGTQALGTGALSANTCATAINIAATGVLAADVIHLTESADWSAITGYGAAAADGLVVYKWPTSGYVNIKVCNGTGTSITPGAATVNIVVTR